MRAAIKWFFIACAVYAVWSAFNGDLSAMAMTLADWIIKGGEVLKEIAERVPEPKI